MTTDTPQKKKKILDFVFHLKDVVKNEKWISHYDLDSDSFALHSPRLSRDARKEYIDDEFALYFNPHSDVQGLFIEYFKSNFMRHHRKLKSILLQKKAAKKTDKSHGLVELPERELRKIAPELGNVIKDSLVKNIRIL